MKKTSILSAAMLSAALTAGSAGIPELGTTPETLPCPKRILHYRQAVIGKDLPGKYALLLFLHGAGERGNDNSRQQLNNFADIIAYCRDHKMKIVVLAPQCPANEQWVDVPWSSRAHKIKTEPSEAMQCVLYLLDQKCAEFDIDPARRYVTGISMGGYGSWDIVCRRPDFFAGALILCGGADTSCAEKLTDLPIRFYHGKSDTIVPVSRSRDMAQALEKAGGKKFEYRELECGHFAWLIVYPDGSNFDWLFSQKREK
ncbi:MAG: hypothetical protein MJ016_00675 [Victivallaceae bacterium]|nr:hypothetical protein [Victivallaceae bacterium]